MPRLWTDSVEAHRRAVREAILDTTWTLVAEHGLTSVTMAQIAERTGIGRATLYKYFPDVEAILAAWHERQVTSHLAELIRLRDATADAGERLAAVLRAYAGIMYGRRGHGPDLTALLHRGAPVARAQRQLLGLFRELLAEAAAAGHVRNDVPPDQLASYCLHALTAAGMLSSRTAIRGLTDVTLAGLRPPDQPQPSTA